MEFRESDVEIAQAQRAERLRAERQGRSLGKSKQRALGISVDSLNQQVEEKNRRLRDEAEREAEYARRERIELAERKRKEDEERARRIAERQDLQEYWTRQEHTRFDRPEGDINRPDRLKIDSFPVEGKVGVSAAQYFDGDDQLLNEHVHERQVQQSKFINEQLAERKLISEEERRTREYFDEMVRNQVVQRNQAALEKERSVRQTNQDFLNSNKNLSQMRGQTALDMKILAEKNAMEENMYIANNTWVGEGSRKISSTGHKVRQEWKGMTPRELERIRNEQLSQIDDMNLRKMKAQQDESKFADSFESSRIHACDMMRKQDNDRRQRALETNLYVKSQIDAKNLRDKNSHLERHAVQATYFPYGKGDP